MKNAFVHGNQVFEFATLDDLTKAIVQSGACVMASHDFKRLNLGFFDPTKDTRFDIRIGLASMGTDHDVTTLGGRQALLDEINGASREKLQMDLKVGKQKAMEDGA